MENTKLNAVGAVLLASGLTMLACCPEKVNAAPGCELTVSFDESTATAGHRAIERINHATGCEVSEANDGVSVLAVKEATYEGAPMCGLTYMTVRTRGDRLEFVHNDDIEVSTAVAGCNSMEGVIIHEMFHAMLGANDVHASGGVFHASSGNGEGITDATLSVVCEHISCPAFIPE